MSALDDRLMCSSPRSDYGRCGIWLWSTGFCGRTPLMPAEGTASVYISPIRRPLWRYVF